jgi:hypothetical protein
MCCSYGIDGMETKGYDCVMIPGASNGLVPIGMKANTYCGRSKGLVLGPAGAIATTVCSKSFFSFSVFVLFFFVSFFISVFIYFIHAFYFFT